MQNGNWGCEGETEWLKGGFDVFKGYRKKSVAWNGLINIKKKWLLVYK